MRHFIEPDSFSLDEQLALLDLADRMEADPAPYAHLCDGRILATLFYEPSTRTRLSFESAMLRLGGKTRKKVPRSAHRCMRASPSSMQATAATPIPPRP